MTVFRHLSKLVPHGNYAAPSSRDFAPSSLLDKGFDAAKGLEAVNLLKSDEFPPPSESCDVCSYLKKRWNFSQKAKGSFNS